MSDAVYAFSNSSGQLIKIDASNINFTGSWSPSTAYFAVSYDTVNLANGQFTAIVNNTAQSPLSTTGFWSPLVLIVPGSGTSNQDNVAQDAFNIAVAGTNLAAEALEIAIIGTNLGTAAYNLATAGSNLAFQAFILAESASSSALAQAAFEIAVIGTNVGTNAYNLAQAGSNIAYSGSITAYTNGQVITSVISNPNTGGIRPNNPGVGAIFYQDPAITLYNEWKWSTSSGTWVQTISP